MSSREYQFHNQEERFVTEPQWLRDYQTKESENWLLQVIDQQDVANVEKIGSKYVVYFSLIFFKVSDDWYCFY